MTMDGSMFTDLKSRMWATEQFYKREYKHLYTSFFLYMSSVKPSKSMSSVKASNWDRSKTKEHGSNTPRVQQLETKPNPESASLENMEVSENSGTPKSSILVRFSVYKPSFLDISIYGSSIWIVTVECFFQHLRERPIWAKDGWKESLWLQSTLW